MIAVIGPPAAGKSAVGELLAARLGVEFIDADEVAGPLYAEVGWSVERLRQRTDEVGFQVAHREWEPVLAHSVRRLVAAEQPAVLALGAGHTHCAGPAEFAIVRAALASLPAVVLLRPSPDAGDCVRILRERCARSKGHEWRSGGVDWLRRWTGDGRDELVATHTVHNAAETPDATARRVAALLGDLRRRGGAAP